MDAGYSMLDAGFWILDSGYSMLDEGNWEAGRLKSDERSEFLHSSFVNRHSTFQRYSALGLRRSVFGMD